MPSRDDDAAARLRALVDVTKVVTAARRFDDLVELAAEEARRALDAASLSITRWEAEAQQMRVMVNVGDLGPDEVRFPVDEVYPASEYPGCTTLVQGRAGFVADVDQDRPEGRMLEGGGKDSCLIVPMVVEGRTWGALYAARRRNQERFTAGELEFAEAVATQVAFAVVQADHVDRVQRLAFTDGLTGLANRRAVDDRLEADLALHLADGRTVAVVLADINRLKQVNDALGHTVGDRLITSIGAAVERAAALVPGSMAARIGGDEFAVVVTGVAQESAVRIAEELCRLVGRLPLSTGVSCGVASTEVPGGPVQTATRLLRLADAAQYRAKRAGSRTPVVAGSVVPAGPQVPERDRRAVRGSVADVLPGALAMGLARLDRLSDAGPQERLQAVADHLSDMVDAAGWWISRCDLDAGQMVSVSSSVQRETDNADAAAVAFMALGATFAFDDYPVSAAAVLGAGAFSVEPGNPGNDPAEETALVVGGYSAMTGAGASVGGEGWLVEIYGDSISLAVADLEPVLRALVCVAVTGAARRTEREAAQPVAGSVAG